MFRQSKNLAIRKWKPSSAGAASSDLRIFPKPIADKWVATLASLKTDKTFNKLIKGLGSIPDIRSPEETKKFVKAQYETFRSVVVKLGIEVKK